MPKFTKKTECNFQWFVKLGVFDLFSAPNTEIAITTPRKFHHGSEI